MPKKYKALVDMSLRQSADPKSPLYQEWIDWKAGEVFEPPPHMDLARCFERGIIEVAGGDVNPPKEDSDREVKP